jgi:predicted CoA-substrate-specific enzyme activase
MAAKYNIGIDIGSTTLKVVVLDASGQVVHKVYRRHKADFNETLLQELKRVRSLFQGEGTPRFTIGVTGSAGMGVAERTGIPFVQEVISSIRVVRERYRDARVLIDLGGEDAKIVFFDEGRQPDIRMNGSCAGGTGSFIDQMADLMNISLEQLADEALEYNKVLPVASRCGVFAKTDVQNLLARNIPRPDIAMSVLHAVALQSITTLARGRDINSTTLCLGGPLTFIPALRQAFVEILGIDPSKLILPENSEYFPAMGVALEQADGESFDDLTPLIEKLKINESFTDDHLPPLFENEEAYRNWKRLRKVKRLKRIDLGEAVRAGSKVNVSNSDKPDETGEPGKPGEKKRVDCFLGIDSGSTTSKMVAMDPSDNIIFSFYDSNRGNPLKTVMRGLRQFTDEANEKGVTVNILSTAVTGYGEDMVKSALNIDHGIVETMAHLTGARYVEPDVSFVLDIGGQDMKSIFIRDGVIANIELNEACSSGCGSFLQNSASAMNLSLSEFTEAACLADHPGDLGSRCTVFMNSKVKQLLRQNATLGDIAAGLSYSVVKNCLFKVLKISNLNTLGDHIVVQGGTFRNDAVYRALELLSGKSVSSTDHPELMGAVGAALYAKKGWQAGKTKTTFSGLDALPNVDRIDTRELQCKGCTNACSILRFRFENGNVCYAGNKCEKVFYNKATAPKKGYNAFGEKNRILFERGVGDKSGNADIAGNGSNGSDKPLKIGIPRVLNMFEHYPFWHTLFTGCGFEVVLSPESNTSLYQKGVGCIMSDNICFPAKLVHGHIIALIDQGVDRIFYPMIIKDRKEFPSASNSYNCPIVCGYPDVVRSSMEPAEKYGVPYDKPVFTFSNEKHLKERCFNYLSPLGVSRELFDNAFRLAKEESNRTHHRLIHAQKERFDQAVKEHKLVFIVAGRPYHADPLVQQKVGQILTDMGAHVFTDDLFRGSDNKELAELNIVTQWPYPNRVVKAALEVARLPMNVQLIQLNSFGCGPDSFFMDEIGQILGRTGKNHTILRIDEIASPGSVRLRMRSLIESLKARKTGLEIDYKPFEKYPSSFTKEDRKRTILAPWLADHLSPYIPALGELAGYTIVNLPRTNKAAAEAGLVYGHNEVCYPSTLVLGDIITALQSGQYDLDDVVVAITQTGGQCRATNYVSQIKFGMASAGFSRIPIVVLATGKVYQNDQSGFKVPLLKITNITIYAMLYADALYEMFNSTVSRELKKGSAKKLFDFYTERGIEAIRANDCKRLLSVLEQAVADFNLVPVHHREVTKVGVIGEIYVRLNSYGQANTSEWLREHGMEVVTTPILDFCMQYFVNSKVNRDNGVMRGSLLKNKLNPVALKFMNRRIEKVEAIKRDYRFYSPPVSIFTQAEYASEVLDLANQYGEGWNIAAEVACFARSGVNRVVCLQPFACIANHIIAKGIEKRLKKLYPT